jgi:hypothetical protein
MGPHRADIIGNDGIVVELQHSAIDATEILEREQFYGSMVWLFDATERFSLFESGDRVFFSLGRVKHLEKCQKRVFLDFGRVVVEVEAFTNRISQFSGVGVRRDRQWFSSLYLSQRLKGGLVSPTWSETGTRPSQSWSTDCPYRAMTHRTRWCVGRAETRIYSKGTTFLPLNYGWGLPGGDSRPAWSYVLEGLPQLANGWTEQDFAAMERFLCGTAIIFDGLLRLLPAPATKLKAVATLALAQELLRQAEAHIREGRIPILKPETKQLLLDRAEHRQAARKSSVLVYPPGLRFPLAARTDDEEPT